MMHSKWIDCGVNIAAFHLQSDLYRQPPSFGKFGKNSGIQNKRKYRKMKGKIEKEDNKDKKDNEELKSSEVWNSLTKFNRFFIRKKKNRKQKKDRSFNDPNYNPKTPKLNSYPLDKRHFDFKTGKSFRGRAGLKVDSNDEDDDYHHEKHNFLKCESRIDGGIDDDSSSLFLQEVTHLLSLLSAVALSSLRHDMEIADTPLGTFRHEEDWPPVDPDQINEKVKRFHYEESTFSIMMMYIFGYTRSTKHRTIYNASRPFKVIGGISESEAILLGDAYGPLAKVTLVLLWLEEFITREYLNGSTGNVAPPIISRCHQTATDGFDAYNQARKIAYTPFPFPHAQITTLYIVVTCVTLPIFMLSYASTIQMAILLNFFSLLCFTGLHEVARELEAPFRNAPNDIPLNNYQAQFNEALICFNAGFHPDSYWILPQSKQPNESADFYLATIENVSDQTNPNDKIDESLDSNVAAVEDVFVLTNPNETTQV